MASTPNTLADLTYKLAVELGSTTEGTATGGSTTTIIDTVTLTQAADYWNTGPVWVMSGSASGWGGPVSDYTTGTITIATMSGTVASGAIFAVGKKRYPWGRLKEKVNQAYRQIGAIPTTDTTLTTVSGSREYTIPTAALTDLREVWLQTKLNDADANCWMLINNWRQELTTLYLPEYPAGYTIKLVYMAKPSDMTSYSSAISSYVPPERIVAQSVINMLLWRKEKLGSKRATLLNQTINYYSDMAQAAKYDYPIVEPPKRNKLAIIGHRGGAYRDEVPAPSA